MRRFPIIATTLIVGCVTGDRADLVTASPGEPPPGMVWIPGGTFDMGGDGPFAGPEERPVHAVQVDGFFIDIHTVTNRRFREFVEATGYVTIAERVPDEAALKKQMPPGATLPPEALLPGSLVFTPTSGPVDLHDWSQWWRWVPGADWRHPTGPASSLVGLENHPAVHIAWDDAVAFATWAGTRLPTEAEWEYAARGTERQAEHTWGKTPYDTSHPQAHLYQGHFPTHRASTVPVGSYPPNAYGLYDMSGNVWQWTLDAFDGGAYRRLAARNPVNSDTASTPMRTLRGGSHLCNDSYCRGYRVSARSPSSRDSGASHIGFRTIMTVDQWKVWKRQRTSG